MPGAPPAARRQPARTPSICSSSPPRIAVLAGGFNSTILREARRKIRELQVAGKTVKVLTIGRKGRDSLRRDYSKLIVDSLIEVGRKRLAL